MFLIIFGVAALILGLYVISIYNYFNVAETRIQASIQEIANQLKRQADLIPNLVESTKGYMKHEKGIFELLTAARQTIVAAIKDPALIDKATAATQSLMPQINALAESNPEMKADGVVTKLMNELRDTADKIMYSRRLLIDLSQDYNAKLKTFPSNLVANAFKFKPQAGLKTPATDSFTSVTTEETQAVKVKLD